MLSNVEVLNLEWSRIPSKLRWMLRHRASSRRLFKLAWKVEWARGRIVSEGELVISVSSSSHNHTPRFLCNFSSFEVAWLLTVVLVTPASQQCHICASTEVYYVPTLKPKTQPLYSCFRCICVWLDELLRISVNLLAQVALPSAEKEA